MTTEPSVSQATQQLRREAAFREMIKIMEIAVTIKERAEKHRQEHEWAQIADCDFCQREATTGV